MEGERKGSSKVGVWIAIGVGVGVALSAVIRNPGMWVGIAVLIALFVSGGLKPRRRI